MSENKEYYVEHRNAEYHNLSFKQKGDVRHTVVATSLEVSELIKIRDAITQFLLEKG
jgi:hypothetical protein